MDRQTAVRDWVVAVRAANVAAMARSRRISELAKRARAAATAIAERARAARSDCAETRVEAQHLRAEHADQAVAERLRHGPVACAIRFAITSPHGRPA